MNLELFCPAVELKNLALLLVVVASAFGACTRVETANPPPSVPLSDGGVGETSGGAGSLAGEMGDGGDSEYRNEGGAPGKIELGVWPTFVAKPSESRDVQSVLAAVATLSLGAMTLPLAERWDQLSGATGSPRALTWSRLDAMTKPVRDRGGGVALCIGIVDRAIPAWPFADGIDSAAAEAAIERTIDEVFVRFGSQVSHLCFGYGLDRYLAGASAGARQRLLAFLEHAVDYASHHPLRGPDSAIGTAITLQALLDSAHAPLDFMLGDEVVALYEPLDEDASLKPPESIVDELRAALATLAATRGSRPQLPLTLFEVGYPSASELGSSEKQQRSYYDALFGLLDQRRSDFGFVGVYGLADRAPADCEAEALSFADPSDAGSLHAWAVARCSMGLQAERPEPDKLTWPTLAAALSRYRK